MDKISELWAEEKRVKMDLHIRCLRIQSLEREMIQQMDPFSSEFENAAESLRKLKEDQDTQGLKWTRLHQQRKELEDEN